MPANTISGFGVGDIVELSGVSFDPLGSATLGANNVLVISANGSSYDLQLDPAANYGGATFSLLSGAERGDRRGIGNRGARRGQQRWGRAVAFQRAGVERRRCHRALRRHYQRAVNYGGGNENIASGGTDIDTTVNDGGTQQVLPGGVASGTLVNDPGLQIVAAGGAATSVTLSGGEEDLYGTTTATTIDSGGVLAIEKGGVATGTAVNGGGVELIGFDGVAISTTISSGGIEYVNFGGKIQGTDNSGGPLGGAEAAPWSKAAAPSWSPPAALLSARRSTADSRTFSAPPSERY